MSTHVSSFNPEQQPLSACPQCSTELCTHLVCRVCESCYACDEFDGAAASPKCHATNPRVAALLAERQLQVTMLECRQRSLQCTCGKPKLRHTLFCNPCYMRLTPELRIGLLRSISTGLIPVWQKCKQLLGQ